MQTTFGQSDLSARRDLKANFIESSVSPYTEQNVKTRSTSLSKMPKLVFTGIKTQCDNKCKKAIVFLDKHEKVDHFDQDMVEELTTLMQKLTEQHGTDGCNKRRTKIPRNLDPDRRCQS